MISNEIIKFASNTSNVGLTNKYTFKSTKKNSMCGDLIKIELISVNSKINSMKLDSTKEIQIKITRPSLYGERYKLFVISKNTFEDKFTLEDYGITLLKEDDKIIIDNLKWNGEAKKSGFEMGDYISEFKIENSDRPSKNIVYPIAILLLVVFGYFNLKRKEKSKITHQVLN